MAESAPKPSLRDRIWRIIFLSDTPAARGFDVVLLWLIIISVLVVMLESVKSVRLQYGSAIYTAEWFFTLLFTIEYLVRIVVSKQRLSYIFSFFGLVDVLSILPTYIHFFFPELEAQHLAVIRILRLLRMFRIFKMARHVGEARVIVDALQNRRPKITVFLFGVMTLVVIMGTLLYLVEGSEDPSSSFSNIPTSIYWAIVTVTTVGYGDITPATPVGKCLSAFMMIVGYAIIAVPTGIVGAELTRGMNIGKRECEDCGSGGHFLSARFCRDCGAPLPPEPRA